MPSESKKKTVSKYIDVEHKVFIETEIARGTQTEEIVRQMREKWQRFKPMKELDLRHIVGGFRVSIVNKNMTEMRKQAASVENHEERIEEKEKKHFERVHTNIGKIEAMKEKWLEQFEDNPESIKKLRSKDIKDLSIVEAIGTRDLRDYKVRRAGRLDNFTGEQLEVVRVRAIEILMKKSKEKNGGVQISAEVKDPETVIEAECEVVSDGEDLREGE
jgi:hypothetical protein